jgi:hypothetical protein
MGLFFRPESWSEPWSMILPAAVPESNRIVEEMCDEQIE